MAQDGDKFSGSFVSLVRHCYGWCRGRQPCRNSAMVSSERHSEDSFSEDSLSSDGTDLSEDLHDLPQSERQGVMIHQYSHALYQPPKDWPLLKHLLAFLGEAHVLQSCWLYSFTSSHPPKAPKDKADKVNWCQWEILQFESISRISLISAPYIHNLHGPLRFGIPMHAARHLNSASASAGPVDDVSFQQDGRPKYIEAGDGRGPKQWHETNFGDVRILLEDLWSRICYDLLRSMVIKNMNTLAVGSRVPWQISGFLACLWWDMAVCAGWWRPPDGQLEWRPKARGEARGRNHSWIRCWNGEAGNCMEYIFLGSFWFGFSKLHFFLLPMLPASKIGIRHSALKSEIPSTSIGNL